jgi:hypothetical protein
LWGAAYALPGAHPGDGARESSEEFAKAMRTETVWASTVTSGSSDARFTRHLLIISRYHPGLYDYVRARFADEDSVEVILDRRRGRDRRSGATGVNAERRSTDRRTHQHVDEALRMESMQFVTLSRGAMHAFPGTGDGGSNDRSV